MLAQGLYGFPRARHRLALGRPDDRIAKESIPTMAQLQTCNTY
jgi:hypothetical protein